MQHTYGLRLLLLMFCFLLCWRFFYFGLFNVVKMIISMLFCFSCFLLWCHKLILYADMDWHAGIQQACVSGLLVCDVRCLSSCIRRDCSFLGGACSAFIWSHLWLLLRDCGSFCLSNTAACIKMWLIVKPFFVNQVLGTFIRGKHFSCRKAGI
jgi:hypothetical protein